MKKLAKEMEERKAKERREELKEKINKKPPPKVKMEDLVSTKIL